MKTLLIIDENGQYVNKQGERCNLICCEWAKGPRANEFTEFITFQEAIAHYELEEYYEPVIEEVIDIPAVVVEEETEQPPEEIEQEQEQS